MNSEDHCATEPRDRLAGDVDFGEMEEKLLARRNLTFGVF